MKVIPSNQTLILASERGTSGGPPTTALARALHNAAADSVLKRVTIVASHPDDTLLYLQADYSSAAESSAHPEPSMTAALGDNAAASLTGLPVRLPQRAIPASSYKSSRGIELYASTQRASAQLMPSETPLSHIDVHA